MKLRYNYSTRVEFRPAVGRHNILLRCQPADEIFQRILSETVYMSDAFWVKEGHDGLGNRIISGGTVQPHSTLQYTSSGVVEQTTYCIPDAEPHPMFRLLPSSLSFPREMLAESLLGEEPFLDRCLRIMHAVHEYLDYCPGVTDVHTSVEEVLRKRQGVCQDFAHVMVALCRAAGFPARYVCGLMAGEGQTHAWVEVHDGQCWYAFDPTNDTAIATGYIKLAHGRNAQDCPVSRGTYLGITTQTTDVKVTVET